MGVKEWVCEGVCRCDCVCGCRFVGCRFECTYRYYCGDGYGHESGVWVLVCLGVDVGVNVIVGVSPGIAGVVRVRVEAVLTGMEVVVVEESFIAFS